MKLDVLTSILQISAECWNKLTPKNFPFASYEFLRALEESQSIGQRTGWFPRYITAMENDEIIGAMILFLKTNSYGEYIFDWAWADAWQKSGAAYYPKLTSAIPFTPATGPKILVAKSADYSQVTNALLEHTLLLQKQEKCSSSHVLFSTPNENEIAEKANFTLRKTFQFHWQNANYEDFDHYLSYLKQKKRQKVRRERKEISRASHIQIKEICGNEVQEHAAAFYELYMSTIDKKYSYDYLTEDFFRLIFEKMPGNILLYLAYRNDQLLAGTLNFIGGDKIYGRYWGAFDEVRHLHFELCYYRPIEYAIKHKFKIFEAGAQGEHKIQRGLIPCPTYSLHHFPETQLAGLIKQHILRENQRIEPFIKQGRSLIYKD